MSSVRMASVMIFLFLLTISVVPGYQAQVLTVNIANKGGDILQETFEANTTEDVLSVTAKQHNGISIKHAIHFPSQTQVFHVTVQPQKTFGEKRTQTFCFVLPVESDQYISVDAMSKLRQKNPHTVRRAEEELPPETFIMEPFPGPEPLFLSRILPGCASPGTRLFHSTTPYNSTDLPVKMAPSSKCGLKRENPEYSPDQPCACACSVCIGWYPCGLKFCQSKQANGETISYRCGIKTCRKCWKFWFTVSKRLDCPVDFYL